LPVAGAAQILSKDHVLVVNPTNHNAKSLAADLQVAARTLGLQLHVLHASTERDFDSAFAALAELRVGALVIGADVFFLSRSTLLGALSVGYAMPAIFQYRPFAVAGGLMSYGSDETEYYRLIGNYTGRILKGVKSSELPVQQATKVELICGRVPGTTGWQRHRPVVAANRCRRQAY
jgi:putative ABC transport system substrate-binding protein